MEACRPYLAAVAGFVFLFAGSLADAATYRTRNFVVTAASVDVARQVAQTSEECRSRLAIEWLGEELPNWSRPCPIQVKVGQLGAGGATTFTFDRGEVSGWKMQVQGTLERILDSVVPHEVSHTIFASYFRRPLPRWADEGAATLIEHISERKRQEVALERLINTDRRIPLNRLLVMSEYPSDMQQVYTLYAEGYSLVNFLVQQRGSVGKKVFLQFLEDAHRHGWNASIRKHYGFGSIGELEQEWVGWVVAGSPPVRRDDEDRLAAAPQTQQNNEEPQTAAVARLSPLPMLDRPLRTESAESLEAPQPGAAPVRTALVNSDEARQLAANGRVLPRRSPYPQESREPSRMDQILAQTANPPAYNVSTARTQPPGGDTIQRGQSPGESTSWTDYTAFPDRESADSATDAPAFD